MTRLQTILLWFVGILAALVLIVGGLGWWGLTHIGYEFPDGDLATHLEGRWDWREENAPCGDRTHVIAFSEDRHSMTITKAATASDSGWHATYDIIELGRSRLRGAIRGEKRKTESGAPVVWDLVMFGPDEFHWHRTDWQQWAYTPAVRRCPALPSRQDH